MKKRLILVVLLIFMMTMVGCGKASENCPATDEVISTPENTYTEVDVDDESADEELETESVVEDNLTEDEDVVIRDRYMVSGSFTVTVRGVIPDYVVDEEPRIAIVTEFQDYPFLLTVGDEIGRQLEEGKAYVFTMEPMEVELVRWNPEQKRVDVTPSELNGIKVIDFRPATEEEIGLASLHPTIE